MLVGAGEIDAALLVVAADDGPNAQTLEHLGLLDALGIRDGLVVVTKADLVDAARVATVTAEAHALIAATTLAGAPILAVSATTGDGVEAVRAAIGRLANQVVARLEDGRGARLAIDRSFTVKGRGTVVTGSLRGGPVRAGTTLRLVPGDGQVRVREVQVRGETVDEAAGGRTALLIGGSDGDAPRRGQVLTTDLEIVPTSRLLVAMRGPATDHAPADRERFRLHVGTDQAGVLVVRGPARRSTCRTGPRSPSCALTRRSPRRPATASPSVVHPRGRSRAAGSCSTPCHRGACRAAG